MTRARRTLRQREEDEARELGRARERLEAHALNMPGAAALAERLQAHIESGASNRYALVLPLTRRRFSSSRKNS